MEKCSGSLFDVVLEAEEEASKPGLPPIDVVMLGLMMTDALKAVHRTFGKFHGDLRPHNILLAAAPAGHDAPRPIGVRLIDFAFTSHLPGRLVSAANGYVAPECIKGQAHSAAGDVYSLGATLLFALTNKKPYGDTDPTKLSQIMFIDSTSYSLRPFHCDHSTDTASVLTVCFVIGGKFKLEPFQQDKASDMQNSRCQFPAMYQRSCPK